METKTLAYEIGKITSIKANKNGFEICQDGLCFWLDKKWGIKPVVGQTIETYGGIGRSIQGICIDGKTAFFKGEVEVDREHKAWLDNHHKEQEETFIKNKKELDEKYDKLPLVFQYRLDILRKNNPKFRVEHEAYEMFCCEEAVKIASVFKKPEEINTFLKMDYEKQRKAFPLMSDGHSGNTFAFSCRLAYWYVTQPDNVWMEHGAMCPLVGCEDCGCWVTNKRSHP